MPVLAVVRHARAAEPPGTSDVDRPLLPEGRQDARAAGAWLRAALGRPALVVASPARRVQETVEELLEALAADGDPPPVVREPGVYRADVDGLLDLVRGWDDAHDPVVLVGHNPGVSELVTALTGTDTRLPTAGTALLRLPSAWAETSLEQAELLSTATPRA